mgnify:FL=1
MRFHLFIFILFFYSLVYSQSSYKYPDYITISDYRMPVYIISEDETSITVRDIDGSKTSVINKDRIELIEYAECLQPLSYEGVLTTETSVVATDMFSRAAIWLSRTYPDVNEVLQLYSREENYIVAKGVFSFTNLNLKVLGIRQQGFDGLISYTLILYFKDNKCKYIIENFSHDADPYYIDNTYIPGVDIGLITQCDRWPASKSITLSDKAKEVLWPAIRERIEDHMSFLIGSMKVSLSTPLPIEQSDW